MIQLPNIPLPQSTATKLSGYQTGVDAETGYEARVAKAKSQFSLRNKSTNAVFRVVRDKLTEMCGGAGRCCYCELSQPDEVEHVRPKDLFPEVVFAWSNYIYACGPCNGTWKNNRFSVIDAYGRLKDVTRPVGAAIVPPANGQAALIDPRAENPLDFFELDLAGTFFFLPIAVAGSVEYERANYTIELLGLNKRPLLPRARRNAFVSYRLRLSEFRDRRDAGASVVELTRLQNELLESPHPAVWRQMQAQFADHLSLRTLFAQVPEALTWS